MSVSKKNDIGGSDKNFSIVFSVVFFIVGIYLSLKNYNLIYWPFLISILLILIGYLKPSILKIPNILWTKFGIFLSRLLNPIILGVIYLLTIIPIGLIFKIINKDPLNKKINLDIDSYWIKRETPPESFKNQF
tara:strand:- start:3321 stop:3719 length:399 start_codon:yes stop_codon:yes gene_type:complete